MLGENADEPTPAAEVTDPEKIAATQQGEEKESMWFKALPDGTPGGAGRSSSTLLPAVDVLGHTRQKSASSSMFGYEPPQAPALARYRQSSSSSSGSSAPSVSSPLARGAPSSPRNSAYRLSSTMALPSVSQLILNDSDAPAEAKPAPPNSRNNSRRNSRVLDYSMPAMTLVPHHEEQQPAAQGPSHQADAEIVPAAPAMQESPSSTSSTSSGGVSGSSEYAEPLSVSSVDTPATLEEQEPVQLPDKTALNLYTAPAQAKAGTLQLLSVDLDEKILTGKIHAPREASSVKARYSVDRWTSFTDTSAHQDEASSSSWTFTLANPLLESGEVEVQLAVAAQISDVDGQGVREVWDSREGQNYSFIMT